MKKITHILVAAMIVGASGILAAQESGGQAKEVKEQAPASAKAVVPLKIQLTLSRFQGEKKLSSVPYVFWLTANQPGGASVRMGNQIPVSNGTGGFTYKDVGTNIDGSAASAPDGGYQISLTVTDSSVYYPDRNDPAAASSTNTGVPAFGSFTSRFSILLRDNQTAPYLSATDPITGQVLRIDATLNVLK